MGQKFYPLSFLFFKHCTNMSFSMLKQQKCKKKWFSWSVSKRTLVCFSEYHANLHQFLILIFEWIFFSFCNFSGLGKLRNTVHTYRKLCVSSFKCTAQIFKIFFCLEVTGLYNVARQFFLRINNFFMSTIEDKWKNILKILYVHFLEETKSFLLVFLNLVCDIP